MKYNTAQNDLSVNPCNPFHPYDTWHANLIRIDGFDGFTDYYGKRIRLFTQPRNSPHQATYCVIPGSRSPLWGGLPGIQSFRNKAHQDPKARQAEIIT